MSDLDGQQREPVVYGDKKAERALRSALSRFSGDGPGRWTFGDHLISDEIAQPFLTLTDELNHLDRRWMS